MIRLETDTRYYLCGAQRDLFGQWEVWRAWGAKGSGLGNAMRMPAVDEHHAQQLLGDVLDLRRSHGYRWVSEDGADLSRSMSTDAVG